VYNAHIYIYLFIYREKESVCVCEGDKNSPGWGGWLKQLADCRAPLSTPDRRGLLRTTAAAAGLACEYFGFATAPVVRIIMGS